MKLKTAAVLIIFCLTFLPAIAQEYHTVIRVIDGDTFEIDNGETVRLIGVDTPETVHPSKPVEYYGKEASEATKNLIEGKSIRLEIDVQERDQYGRLLAYVFVPAEYGDIFANAWLVQNGYAQVFTYPPNVKYVEVFQHLQGEAQRNNVGLWNEDVTTTIVSTPAPKPTVTEEKKSITVYRTRTGSKYHKAGCRYLSRSSIPISLDIAKGQFSACSVCKPPQE